MTDNLVASGYLQAMDSDRHSMAELIGSRGPMDGDAIRGALDWDFGRIRKVVAGEPAWFVLTAQGWDLTERGRAEMEKGKPRKRKGR